MHLLNRNFNPSTTQASYKNVAWFYNVWSALTESKAAKRVLAFADIKEGDTILEVACGTGIVFERIVKHNKSGTNVGIDLSPHMLAKAQKRIQKIKNGNFELKEGDVLKLNFKENTFDLLINNFMIDLMPADTFNPIAQTFYKLLKPGGRLVISNFSFGTKKVHKFWFWLAKTFPSLLAGCRPVSFKEHLVLAGFKIQETVEISQNTFPAQVIYAKK